jgi:hypothetical protein
MKFENDFLQTHIRKNAVVNNVLVLMLVILNIRDCKVANTKMD